MIQQLRNEAHRFGITFHRQKRSKNTIKTSLTDIEGIGEKTATILLRHFRSVKRIEEASLEELGEVVNANHAKLVFEFYNNSN